MEKLLYKIKKRIFDIDLFTMLYIFFTAINMVMIFNVMSIARILMIIFGLWSAVLFIKIYIIDKKKNDRNIYLLMSLMVICIISEIINFRYGGISSLAKLFFTGISVMILYTQGNNSEQKQITLIHNIAQMLRIVISLLLLISILMFIFNVSVPVKLRSGDIAYMGVYENRLNGLFSSSNIGGMYAIILLGLNVYRIVGINEKNVMHVIEMIVEYLIAVTYISLALSRGTYISLSVFWVSVIMFSMFHNDYKTLKKILLKFCVFVIGIFITYVFVISLRKICVAGMELTIQYKNSAQHENLVNNIKSDNNTIDNKEDNSAGKVDNEINSSQDEPQNDIEKIKEGFAGRTESGRKDIDFTNKRKDIWQAHLSLLDNPYRLLLGVNNPYIYMTKKVDNGEGLSHYQIKWIEWASGNMHNGYIQLLINCGGCALIVLIEYLVRSLFYTSKCIITCKIKLKKNSMIINSFNEYIVILALVCAFAINNIFEANILLYGTNFLQNIFWYMAGVCYCYVDRNYQIFGVKHGDNE